MKQIKTILPMFLLVIFLSAPLLDAQPRQRSSRASYPEFVTFSSSSSSKSGAVYEVLPGPAVINPAMNPTPFSNNVARSSGSYSLTVADMDAEDSPDSKDMVKSVEILFTGNDGRRYKIDKINVIHKPAGAGDHSFFGGVGMNKMMHGNTGIGIGLMPRMMAYITLWGITDLKDAETDSVIATGRVIHLMVATRVRDENLRMMAGVEKDSSNYDFNKAETHIILPPQDTRGNMSPVPGTKHGFLHMMFEDVKLGSPSRDWTLAYEVLPGPAVINPAMNPTPFSNRVALGAGSFALKVADVDTVDSPSSRDRVLEFNLRYKRLNGDVFTVDGVSVIHKPEGAGDHSFFGGVGIDKMMHGNTGIGVGLMPRMLAYITLWGIADVKDGGGNVIASRRVVHIMVASRVRTDDLSLITSTDKDMSDHSPDRVEVHIFFPPQDTQGNMSPVPGVGHGFLHLMFEKVTLDPIITNVRDVADAAPNSLTLMQNYPNPFSPSTTISFAQPQADNVTVKIYDSMGRLVRTLLSNRDLPAGRHSVVWNATDDNGARVAGGAYLYEVQAGAFTARRKLVLTK